jgi:hypothetical protein
MKINGNLLSLQALAVSEMKKVFLCLQKWPSLSDTLVVLCSL